jgi:alpha-tubulin suppressor-like RCC1 family protein
LYPAFAYAIQLTETAFHLNQEMKTLGINLQGYFLIVALQLVVAPGCFAGGSVAAWGAYYDLTFGAEQYRPMYVPAGLTNVIGISGGYNHAAALKADGTVAAWGWNGNNQLTVPTNVTNIVAVSAGWGFTLALKSDSTVVGWGTFSGTGPMVPPGLTNVAAIAAGGLTGLAFGSALKTDGTVTTWGGGLYGPPVPPAGLSNVVSVSAGYRHVLALRIDGSVVAWGVNGAGETTNIPAGLTRVVEVAAGSSHSLALRTDGTVVGWPSGLSAANVPVGLSNVVSIAAGYFHSMAIKNDGTVVAWGAGTNYVPGVGDMNKGQSIVPVGLSNVFSIAGGLSFSLALTNDSGAPSIRAPLINQTVGEGAKVWMPFGVSGSQPLSYQWHFNGTNITSETNSTLVLNGVHLEDSGTYSVVASNTLGVVSNSSTLAIVPLLITLQPQAGSVFLNNSFSLNAGAEGPNLYYQWKFNGADIAGQTNSSLVISNAQFSDIGGYSVVVSNISSVVPSATANLLVKQIAAWGSDGYGQSDVPQDLTNAVAISAGWGHSLALKTDGKVTAWGYNGNGQTNVPPDLSGVVAISAGYVMSAALKSNGEVVAWGSSSQGLTNIPGSLTNAVAIACGSGHVLVLKSDGTLVSWGSNDSGQTNVPAGLSNVVAIAAKGNSSAALRVDGKIVVWGSSYYNQTNVPPSVTNAIAVAVGGDSDATAILALKPEGAVLGWGYGGFGQTSVPVDLSNVFAIAAGNYPTLALKYDGTVVVWGGYVSTNTPPDLARAVAIAGGGYHSLALVGNNPPALNAPLSNPVRGANGFSISLPTRSGRVYMLEYKNSIEDGNWMALPLVPGNGGVQTLVDPTADVARRFYRVRQW